MSGKEALTPEQSELVQAHRYLVDILATKMSKRLPLYIEMDDLVQWGSMGLMEAAKRFDGSRGYKFSSYAQHRIRGAMLDGLRAMDELGRNATDARKRIEQFESSFKAKNGKSPSEEELARGLGIDDDDLCLYRAKAFPVAHVSIDSLELFTKEDRKNLLESASNQGGNLTVKIEALEKLEHIIAGHKPINRACFILYYVWGFTNREIAECFGCTESRISQRLKFVHLNHWGAADNFKASEAS